MVQIAYSFGQRRDGELSRSRTAPEPADLREYVPHPVAALLSSPQLRVNPINDTALRIDKTLQVVRIFHDDTLP
jgi:hypothetical protein